MPTYKRIKEKIITYDCKLKEKRGYNNISCDYPKSDYCCECEIYHKLEFLEE